MARNLDLTALRAFATVASTGGVTRAAALLNLTQSAVSMQVKRLEEALDTTLLERTSRGMRLTPDGESALGTARRMLALNDELLDRMRNATPDGEIRLGVPHDIVPRAIPDVLRAFAAEYPRVRITLVSSVTAALHDAFAAGEVDVMLGTEAAVRDGGEEIVRLPLIWVGAEDGRAWRQRPLRLAFEQHCVFRTNAQAALDRAGIPWELALSAASSRAIDASVAADLACHVVIDGFDTAELTPVRHGGGLPEIGDVGITIYAAETERDPARDRLLELLRQSYRALRGSRQPSLSIAAS
ncbi:LysR family transcriptional regulator [Jannaschia seohaensis]|uniref:DNA-binding transcriptional LysR family regulator n=1 Tax=Jannaschia seohaensis TaxID=475081 RepID=A0A2Y9C897_9RHOB|nr:LysR family transcriptional regulator [Jannaschia seohaensis]PWJ17005.1 DNA-binding transcriptional LysR family regulator [Jannaschia seohaensis]SSA48333.1 DNA-binding transcriptional regulator, LysR family [Jannaschia seohaensis]